MTLIIAGGVYHERCLTPSSVELFGSGGRAAVALSGLTDVALHTFFPDEFRQDIAANFDLFGVETHVYPSTDVTEFHYHFPLSPPRFAPIPLPTADAVRVSGDKLVRFGCVEGEMIVDAKIAVYDPQSSCQPAPFKENGSRAEKLAIVLNQAELHKLSHGNTTIDLIANLSDSPNVVIVKNGPHGASVYEDKQLVGNVPVFKTDRVYKIGSGDIFTAMFAYNWCELGHTPYDSALAASLCVSHYVETRDKQIPSDLPNREPWNPSKKPRKVYLAGSFFSAEHVWLIEETRAALQSMGIPVFSPYHDVGLGTGAEIAEADLEGLDECGLVFALISDRDPGTLFEIGYAKAKGQLAIAFVENPGPQDLTMITGSGFTTFDDLSTAIYHVAWAAME